MEHSFMPILVVLVLCVITQDVFISISAAIWVGSWMLERDAWIGMLRFLDTRLPDGLKDMTIIILFAWLLGGVIGAANKSGGMKALGDKAVVLIKDSFLAQLVVFLFGFVVFMDDYGNTLIVGNNMRPITDRMRLSREKLSFLVDCTSAPIASLTPLSTWISFELGLINQQLDAIGYDDESGFTLFLDSIPKRFYAWFMLAMVLGSILLQRDWGPMYDAELRARKGEGVAPPDPTMTEEDYEEMLGGGVKPKKDIPYRAWNAVVPFFGMVAAFIPLLFYSGARQAPWGGIGWDNSSRNIMGNADSYATLMWLGGFTIMLQVVMYACQYSKETGMLMTPSETVAAAIEGSKDLMEATIVLILASAVGTVVQECMLPDVLIDTIGDSIPGRALPALVFVVGAFIALATGSSWTTMIILFPIAIPLADISSGASKRVLLTNTIAAILGGAVWGDHCSPISDTTVLSAAACRVKTIAHVKTQLPYALLAGTNATLIGYLLNGYGVPAVLLILLGFVFMPAQYYGMSQIPGWGGRTPIYDPEHDKVVGEGLRGSIASIKRNILSCGRVKPDAASFDEKAAAASPKEVGAPPADEEA
jgi:Na+/H+ antiporter NhaC